MSTPRNTIRTFALTCVAIISIFVIAMSVWIVRTIANTDWCGKIIGSSDYAGGRPDFAVKGCVDVMLAQIGALANNSMIFGGVIALCLLALMVIVVAGGKLSFSGPGGFGGAVGRDLPDEPITPADGAEQAAQAAQEVAEDLKAQDAAALAQQFKDEAK